MVMMEHHSIFSDYYKTYYLVAFMVFLAIFGLLAGISINIQAWNACDKKIDERSNQLASVNISMYVFGGLAAILLATLFMLKVE